MTIVDLVLGEVAMFEGSMNPNVTSHMKQTQTIAIRIFKPCILL